MVDRDILVTRLSKLREYLRRLRGISERPRAEYLASETDRALAEHFLRLALETMLDAGNHVIAAEAMRKPLRLRDIPIVLAENGVLPRELGERLAQATGLRNRLVHVYADIDHEIIYGVLQSGLSDLEAFAVAVADYCERLS